MSHSKAANTSEDLEHLELTEELNSAAAEDSQPEIRSPPLDKTSRRVSINSLDSASSNSTVKYQAPADPSPAGPSSSRPRSSSRGSHSTPARRPKPSYRHSSANISGELPPSSSGTRRRRPYSARPGSTRSSIHQRTRSSDNDQIFGRVSEQSDDEDEDEQDARSTHSRLSRSTSAKRSLRGEEHEGEGEEDDASDAGPQTLKDRQETLNQTHPFGLPLWKPALYKKSRSVTRKADSALHSQPSSDLYLSVGNLLWTLIFGWWMSIVCIVVAVILYLTPFGGRPYGRVVLGLSYYLLWPFGQYVERELAPGETRIQSLHSTTFSDFNGHGHGRHGHSMNSDESRPLLPRSSSGQVREPKISFLTQTLTMIKRLPGTILQLGFGGVVYYVLYYCLIGPLHMLVSCLCWFMVISIPMGKLTYVLASHLHRDPLRLNFKRGSSVALSPHRSEILLCTYDAIGFQYYKYTYDGTNIIFINLMPVVLFTILDDYVLTKFLGHDSMLTSPAVIFSLGLASVIPLSYFIGMAVSSISAQSSLGMGAVINATFGSIIEIILYSVALTQGKSLITEGALIGSFLAGLLLMPGLSMMSGAIKKKEQKFNAKSAGVTATMLIMSLIGVLTPTLFYSIHGQFELRCTPCPESVLLPNQTTCQRCYHHQPHPADDAFFQKTVKPLMYFCCIILPSAYLIGIWFSLRTHVKQIWHEPQPAVRDSSLYRKLLPTHIIQQLLHYGSNVHAAANRPHTNADDAEMGNFSSAGAAHPAPGYQSISIHDGTADRRAPHSAPGPHTAPMNPSATTANPLLYPTDAEGLLSSLSIEEAGLKSDHGEDDDEEAHGGHDSPNWSKGKSATVLLGCTVLYSIIAEILVDSVDAVSSVDEKLLGLTLFALVPNVTEFMNAISFAMYGNIALSMEIGSAYALQVCLIQIPAMVAVSAWMSYGKDQLWQYTFNLIFPRWDVISMLFSVFLLTYTYIEGKSNYFKGSILILSYIVLIAGFYYGTDDSNVGYIAA